MIFKSIDQGNSWQMINELFLTSFDLECDSSDNLYIATSNYLYKSTDLGLIWNISYFGWISNLCIGSNNLIYAHNSQDLMYSYGGSVSTWIDLSLTGTNIYDIIEIDDTIYVGTGTSSISTYLQTKGLQKSSDLGINWNICFRYSDKFVKVNHVLFFDDKIIATGTGGLYLSTDNGNNWETSIPVNTSLIKKDSFGRLYATTLIDYQSNGILYRSIDEGETWEPCISGVNIFSLTDSNHILAAKSVRLLKSIDYGTSWDTLNNLSNFPVTNKLISISQNPYGTIYISTYWRFYVPGHGYVVYTYLISSSNNGEDWDILNQLYVSNIYFIDSTMYLTTFNGGIYKSINAGVDVVAINNGLANLNVKQLLITTNHDFICVTGNGIYCSLDQGNSWWRLDHSGLLSTDINSIFNSETGVLYACTNNGIGIFVGELLSVGEGINQSIPNEYKISQNYPNPFNPSTKIKYSLPYSGNVQIKVYNVLGKEVQTLVNEFKSVGDYEINFDASNLPSGVYFYRIQSGSFSETKKMILLR